MKFISAAIIGALLLVSLAVPLSSASAATPDASTVAVLFDFGNGQVMWADVPITAETNAYNATVLATDELGLGLEATDWGAWGMAIDTIGGLGYNGDTGEWWGFWTWNSTSSAWEMAAVGASFVTASSVSAVAWVYTPTSNAPLATPEHRYPWASFRHDALNTGSQLVYRPNSLALSWQKDLANGAIDSPIVAAGGYEYIVTGGRLNMTTYAYDTNSAVFCLNETGNIVWSKDIGTGYQVGAPLIVGNALIVPSGNGKIYAFNALNGTTLWGPFDTGSATNDGVTSSPIAYLDQVIVAAGNGKLFSLYATNGSVAWESAPIAPVVSSGYDAKAIYSSSPAISNGTIYIGSVDGKLHALTASSGQELWNLSIGAEIKGSPILMDDMIVISFMNHTGSSATSGGLAAVNYDGQLLWQTSLGVTPTSATLATNGLAVVTSTGLAMVGFTGNILWNVSLGTLGAGAAPTAVNGTIFVVTNEASSRLIAISENGTKVWQQALGSEYALSAPSVADGVLYVAGDNGQVYAFKFNAQPPSSALFTKSIEGLSVNYTIDQPVDGSLYTYSWDFGDGNTTTGRTANHTYGSAGNYTVVLTVTDLLGNEKSSTQAVVVGGSSDPQTQGDLLGVPMLGWAVIVIALIALVGGVVFMRRKK
jgi:outer membrane protein assembly factor BamB